MKLSIIIPVYNVEPFISRCLNSVINQDLSKDDYEIIVVDDGTPDNSMKIVNALATQHDNIIAVSQVNSGLSVARNTGMKCASGDYIMFVDSDDWIETNVLGKLMNLCYRDSLDILRFCVADVRNGYITRRYSVSESCEPISGKELIKNTIQVCATFSIYKRELLIKHNVEFYPGIFHEDNEFTPRVYYFAKRVKCINDIVYFIFQNPRSITRTVNPKKAFDLCVVMKQLHSFCDSIPKSGRISIEPYIVLAFNACLHNTYSMDSPDIDKLNKELYEHRHSFLKYLFFSKNLKYCVEGILMSIFPHNQVKVYKLLRHFLNKNVK